MVPRALGKDWIPFTELTRPQGDEWLDGSLEDTESWTLRLLLASAIAESEGQ